MYGIFYRAFEIGDDGYSLYSDAFGSAGKLLRRRKKVREIMINYYTQVLK